MPTPSSLKERRFRSSSARTPAGRRVPLGGWLAAGPGTGRRAEDRRLRGRARRLPDLRPALQPTRLRRPGDPGRAGPGPGGGRRRRDRGDGDRRRAGSCRPDAEDPAGTEAREIPSSHRRPARSRHVPLPLPLPLGRRARSGSRQRLRRLRLPASSRAITCRPTTSTGSQAAIPPERAARQPGGLPVVEHGPRTSSTSPPAGSATAWHQAGGATGVDILDGDKAQVSYGCGRSEVTFSRRGGGFIANIDGPVRAIRSYIGANSGTYTQRDHVYYQQQRGDHHLPARPPGDLDDQPVPRLLGGGRRDDLPELGRCRSA